MNPFKFAVSLRYSGKTTDPDLICEHLGLTPKFKHRLGNPRTTPTGQPLKGHYDAHYCLFKIACDQYSELHECLEGTLNNLMKSKAIFDLVKQNGDRFEFFIGWFSTGNTGDIFGSKLIAQLAALNIELAFDVYGESAE